MSTSRFYFLLERNPVGTIKKIVSPDLRLNLMDSYKKLYEQKFGEQPASKITYLNRAELKGLAQDFIDANHLNILPQSMNDWSIKEEDNLSYEWIAIDLKVFGRCNGLRKIAPHIVTLIFLATLGAGEYLEYLLNVVNEVPPKVATASIATGVFLELVQYYASNTSANMASLIDYACKSKIPETGYDLKEDFKVDTSSRKYSYFIAATFSAMQIFNMVVSLESYYHLSMMQYEEAYKQGLVGMSYDNFMRFVKINFYADAAWMFIIPLNLALSTASTLESMSRKLFSSCFSRCRRSNQESKENENGTDYSFDLEASDFSSRRSPASVSLTDVGQYRRLQNTPTQKDADEKHERRSRASFCVIA